MVAVWKALCVALDWHLEELIQGYIDLTLLVKVKCDVYSRAVSIPRNTASHFVRSR